MSDQHRRWQSQNTLKSSNKQFSKHSFCPSLFYSHFSLSNNLLHFFFHYFSQPSSHYLGTSRNATFTLTNVVPQNPELNRKAWRNHESEFTDLFRKKCSQAFVLVGAVPSANNWIIKKNVRRVNIPEYLWNAYCCVDNNGRPIQSGAGAARNTEDNWVEKLTLDELGEFLQQFTNQPVGELFYNNCRA